MTSAVVGAFPPECSHRRVPAYRPLCCPVSPATPVSRCRHSPRVRSPDWNSTQPMSLPSLPHVNHSALMESVEEQQTSETFSPLLVASPISPPANSSALKMSQTPQLSVPARRRARGFFGSYSRTFPSAGTMQNGCVGTGDVGGPFIDADCWFAWPWFGHQPAPLG